MSESLDLFGGKVLSILAQQPLSSLIIISGLALIVIAQLTNAEIFGIKFQTDKIGRLILTMLGALLLVIGISQISGKAFSDLPDPLSSKDPVSLFKYGQRLENLKDYKGALKVYRRTLQLAPKDASEVWFRYATAQKNLGDPRNAVESFSKVIYLDPNNFNALLGRGDSLLEIQDFDEAIASYDEALKLEQSVTAGSRSAAWNNRGIALESLGRLDEAVESYSSAYWLDPDDSTIQQNLKRLNKEPIPISEISRLTNIPIYPSRFSNKDYSFENGEVEIDIDKVPFLKSSFPRNSCGDSFPERFERDSIKLYPVFIEYSAESLSRVKVEFCRDAFKNEINNKIQVASFILPDRANQFKKFMVSEFGSGMVGAARIISPES